MQDIIKDIFSDEKRYVITYDSSSSFPPVGTGDTIYFDSTTNALYIWNGSSYIPLNIQTVWGYQDFAPGVINSTSVTLTANENGTNSQFTPANFYNYAAIYNSDNTEYVYTSGFFGMFAGLVDVTIQSGASITLNKIPNPATNCRIWYLFQGVIPVSGYIIPPENILDSAAAVKLDSFFLTLDDLSATAPIVYDNTTGIISLDHNTTNLKITADQLNTIQDISTAASPTFVGSTLSGTTEGSILFAGAGGLVSQDNPNLFWDDSINRLGIGTNSFFSSSSGVHIVGDIELDHTALEPDCHALEIVVDTGGFGDVKAIDIDYVTNTIGTAQEEGIMLINIDESASTGGEVFGLEILTTTLGSADVIGMKTGIGVDPIGQFVGTFADPASFLVKTADQLTAISDGGAGNITFFVDDNDTITIGLATKFEEIEILVDTGASGAGIAPKFEISTGVGTWSEFTPTDGTNGFRNTGVILFDDATVPSWATGTGAEFLIRITRRRNSLSTVPIVDEVQVSAVTVYKWDKNANIIANNITTVTQSPGNNSTYSATTAYVEAAVTASNQTTSGTANRIQVTDGTTDPIIDISSSYVGQTSITTVGTITSGIWNAGAITSSGELSINGTGDSYFTGQLGVGTTTPVTSLQVNAKVTGDNSFSYTTDALMVINQTPTSTATLNDPQDVLYLARQGTPTDTYGAAATFRLSRYEAASWNSRTRLDISLAHDTFDQVDVFTLKSNGDLAITGTITNGIWNAGAITSSGAIKTTDTTESTSSTTGSGIFAGGVGIAKRLNVAGLSSFGDSLQVTGAGNHTSGSGIEITGGAATRLLSYNRDFASYLTAQYNALTHSFLASGFTRLTITSTGIAITGVVSSGTWEGAAIADAYISSATTWNATTSTVNSGATNWDTAYTHSQLTSGNPHSVTKSDVGLGNVENTALSTWAGSSNITTVGTITTGTWSGLFGAVTGANLTSLTAANISAGTAGIDISGNAATATLASTVTTNANLTGDVTSVGNATTIGALKVTNAMLAGSITASKLIGTDIATVGTITSGTWNAGAITSSGDINIIGSNQLIFSQIDTTNNLKLQFWGGYGLGINTSTLFYAANGFHDFRDLGGTNTRMRLSTVSNGGLSVFGTGNSYFTGNLGVGLIPVSKLDVQAAARSGSHGNASDTALYATAGSGAGGYLDGIAEFRHSNGTQGIGFGYQAIYAAGSNASQNISLMPKGTGGIGVNTLTPTEDFTVLSSSNVEASIVAGGENLDATFFLGTPNVGDINSAKKAAIIAEGVTTWSRSKLHFCLNDVASNSSIYDAAIADSKMTLLYSGNAGIGNTNPESILHVEESGQTGIIMRSTGSNAALTLDSQGSGGDSWIISSKIGDGALQVFNVDTVTVLQKMLPGGELITPSNPAFKARNTTFRTNVTGNGTFYTLIFNTEDYDRGANFDGTSTYTAPVTGVYELKLSVDLQNLTSSHTAMILEIVTTSTTHILFNGNPGAMRDGLSNSLIVGDSIQVLMSAGNTAVCKVIIVGSGSDDVDIDSGEDTRFSGTLIG